MNKLKYILLVTIMSLVLGGCINNKTSTGKAVPGLDKVKTATVENAGIDITLRVPGVLESSLQEPVYCEVNNTKIKWVMADGSKVKKGDVVIKLDTTETEKQLNDIQTKIKEAEKQALDNGINAQKAVQNAESALEKAKEDLNLKHIQTTAQKEKAKADVEFLKKELELAQGELDKKQRLAAERLIARTEVDAAEDRLSDKQFELEKAQAQMEKTEKDTALDDSISQMDIEKQELELELAKIALEETLADNERNRLTMEENLLDAQLNQELCDIVSESDGMLLLEKTWEGEYRTFRAGDNVYEGRKLASIINSSKMQIKCDINESDIDLIKADQKARIKVAALEGLQLKGIVDNVDNLARERFWWEGGTPGKRIFAAMIKVEDPTSELRPGMSASIEIILDTTPKALTVPLDAIFRKKDAKVIYKKQSYGFVEIPVKVLKSNEMLAQVEGKLKDGDVVSLERPSAELLAGGVAKLEKS